MEFRGRSHKLLLLGVYIFTVHDTLKIEGTEREREGFYMASWI